jgi:hypothetical protein
MTLKEALAKVIQRRGMKGETEDELLAGVRTAVLLNAAAALAAESIDSGAAAARLEALRRGATP